MAGTSRSITTHSEKEARATAADARTSGAKTVLLKADLSREAETPRSSRRGR